MKVRFSELFGEGIEQWPRSIDISDGDKIDGENGYFKKLSLIWDEVELKYGIKDDWKGLITWGIFCGLHKLAIEKYNSGINEILTSDIDAKYVQERLSSSLYADLSELEGNSQWSNEFKAAYVNDMSS